MLRLTESSISKLMPMLPRQTELEAVTRVEKFAVGAELGDFFHLSGPGPNYQSFQ